MEQAKFSMLTEKAREIRLGAVEAVYSAASGHPGGSLSIADILSYLYFEEMNVDPADPKKADRDRFVLSKGHTAPALYAALAARGFFDKSLLTTLRQVDYAEDPSLRGKGCCKGASLLLSDHNHNRHHPLP